MSLLNPGANSEAQVVFDVKQRPPINFNVTLHQHALQHGLAVHGQIGFHPHTEGTKMSIHVSGPSLGHIKSFADTATERFGVYIKNATVNFEKEASSKRW